MASDELSTLTVAALRKLATEFGIRGRSTMKKAELVAALRRARERGGVENPSIPDPEEAPRATSSSSSHAEPSPAVAPAGPAAGLPIPERYGRTVCRLLVQDPYHLYAYWEVTDEDLAEARANLDASARPVLIVRGPEGEEVRQVDLDAGNYYLSVVPDAAFRVLLALSDGERLHVLASPDEVRTPRPSVSARGDAAWLGRHGERMVSVPAPLGASEGLHRRGEHWERVGGLPSSPSSWSSAALGRRR